VADEGYNDGGNVGAVGDRAEVADDNMQGRGPEGKVNAQVNAVPKEWW